jgi:hypothetical protein
MEDVNMTENVKLASKRQTWALFCITKEDYRTTRPDLTYDEASKLIEELNATKGYTAKAKTVKVGVDKTNKAVEIHTTATQAGYDAMLACVPQPMIVVDGGPETGGIVEGGKEYFVEGGACGFAWVHFKATTPANRAFLAGLKAAGLAGDTVDFVWRKDTYRGGYQLSVSVGGQSITRKEAYGGAYAQVLRDNGITAYMMSRMD